MRSRSVVIGNLHVGWSLTGYPGEADSIFVVDSYRMLADSAPRSRGWSLLLGGIPGSRRLVMLFELVQFAPGDVVQIFGYVFNALGLEIPL